MNKNIFKMIGLAVIVVILGICFKMYSDSVNEDFKDIPRNEVTRIGDHYTGQYHRPGCPKVKQIYGDGIKFENKEAAVAEGYSACKRCDAAGPNE